jgi:phosphopantothenoylcysteine decarboxylase/phosphopantothenate--cysteine ligase
MDAGMYENPVTQTHVQTLMARGVHFAGPGIGRMASGLEGLGRFLEPEEILGHCRRVLGMDGPLAGRQVVVSAGPSREALDPVRFLSNHSSGKQGFAIAQAAIDAGAEVTLIAGPLNRSTPVGAARVDVEDARSMRDAVLEYACSRPADALIMAAAVADFRPAEFSDQKIKKGEGEAPSLMLARNPDILMEVANQPQRPRVTVGFAAESQELAENARGKLARKKLDLIVANDITARDAGFSAETNRVLLITPDRAEELPLLSKDEVARRIILWLTDRLASL